MAFIKQIIISTIYKTPRISVLRLSALCIAAALVLFIAAPVNRPVENTLGDVNAELMELDEDGGSFGGDAAFGPNAVGGDAAAGGQPGGGLFSGNPFIGIDMDAGSYLADVLEGEYDNVGIGAISLIPGLADGDAAGPDGSGPEGGPGGDGEGAGPDGSGTEGDGASNGAGSMSGLMSNSDEFDLDFWMEGFDPDADFGGLGFETETGPGMVSISVIDTDGVFIDGIVITENGFRTSMSTSGGTPLEISDIPYGERVYGVFLTYSFDIDSVIIQKFVDIGGGQTEALRIETEDINNVPPVVISDESYIWELTFILKQSMKINVSYYMVSPNDRFYFLRYDEAPATAVTDDGDEMEFINAENAEPSISYHIKTFRDAPVRIAIYIEMPSIKGIRSIRVKGEGFGDMDDELPWIVEGWHGDFSLTDLTVTDRSWQLISCDSDIGPDDASFIRFLILNLPYAYEDAWLKFNGLTLYMEDGSEAVFENPSLSDLTVWLVEAPELL